MTTTDVRSSTGLPCVWMSAGVLSYRLCDREYECERCPLFLALRGGTTPAPRDDELGCDPPVLEDPVGKYLAALGSGCTLHLDRAYTPEGLWLMPEASGELVVGLDDYTLRLLQPVDGIMLPRAGVWLGHAAPCAWLNRGRLAVALRAPLAGEVTEVHPDPALRIPLAGNHADQRWWFKIRPHEPLDEAGGLMHNESLLTWFLTRVRAVHQELDTVMADGRGTVGVTMHDGGIPNFNLEIVLGRERFHALVGMLFPLQT